MSNGFREMAPFSAQQSLSQRRRIGEPVTRACGLVCTVQDWRAEGACGRVVCQYADRIVIR